MWGGPPGSHRKITEVSGVTSGVFAHAPTAVEAAAKVPACRKVLRETGLGQNLEFMSALWWESRKDR